MKTLMTTVFVLLILAGLVRVWNGAPHGPQDRIHHNQRVALKVRM